jgi:methionine-S-sulfoxide reductase
MDTAVFAAGCFWCVEDAFMGIAGVVATRAGYTGGHTDHPTYREVCGHDTGHAEAVQVTFDPEIVSYERLLEFFWEIHDPTQVNRQGPDVGAQYRSAIFCNSEQQRRLAEVSRDTLDRSGRLRRPVATVIAPLTTFWEAEEYHQKYYPKRAEGVL